MLVVFEPEDRRSQHASTRQVLPHPRFDVAQVLADDHGAGPVRLQDQHADHRLVVVAHVGAGPRAQSVGNPPEPEEADDVIDAQCTRMPQQTPDEIAQRGIPGPRERGREPWWLEPVLPLLVIHVRRCADRDSGRVQRAERPGIRPERVDTHREVVHDPDTHAGLHRGVLRRCQLIVGDPLQPRVEGDPTGEAFAKLRDKGGAGIPRLGRPRLSAREGPGVVLLDRAPQREVGERDSLARNDPLECPLPFGVAGNGEEYLEHLLLRAPHGVPVDE